MTDCNVLLCLLQCSQSCGQGIQRRNVNCVHFGVVVPPQECKHKEKPVEEKRCNQSDCEDEYFWQPGVWQPVSVNLLYL